MITVRIYRDVEYTTAPMPDGMWKWIFYPDGVVGGKCEGRTAGAESEAAQSCRDAIDRMLGAPDCPAANPAVGMDVAASS